jgi:hypothetical protein
MLGKKRCDIFTYNCTVQCVITPLSCIFFSPAAMLPLNSQPLRRSERERRPSRRVRDIEDSAQPSTEVRRRSPKRLRKETHVRSFHTTFVPALCLIFDEQRQGAGSSSSSHAHAEILPTTSPQILNVTAPTERRLNLSSTDPWWLSFPSSMARSQWKPPTWNHTCIPKFQVAPMLKHIGALSGPKLE